MRGRKSRTHFAFLGYSKMLFLHALPLKMTKIGIRLGCQAKCKTHYRREYVGIDEMSGTLGTAKCACPKIVVLPPPQTFVHYIFQGANTKTKCILAQVQARTLFFDLNKSLYPSRAITS